MKIATLLLAATILVFPAAVLTQPRQRDVPAEVEAARRALQSAHNELEHAGGEWRGHRANAMKHIQEAIRELSEAEEWAKQHHEIK